MKTLIVLILTLAMQAGFAGEAPWVSLFNGKDFSGWKIVGPSNLAYTEVSNGEMFLRQRINTLEHTFVTTEAKYGDFILEADCKIDGELHTGFLLRCVDNPPEAKLRLNGYQVKIDPTTRAWTGGVFDDFGPNWKWMFDLKDDTRARSAFKVGVWNSFRIEAIGNSIKVWVNGIPTCNLIDEKYGNGYIALKIHSMGNTPEKEKVGMHYRNLRIITSDPAKYAQPIDIPSRRANP